jgi:hypothetical protein
MDERTIARGVGGLSLGLGLAMTVAPARAAELTGMTGARPLVRFLGARDLVIGAGLVSGRAPRSWAQARAVADTADAAMLATGLVSGTFDRPRAALGIGVAATFGALGFWLAGRLR